MKYYMKITLNSMVFLIYFQMMIRLYIIAIPQGFINMNWGAKK